jgi:hypothetical protein
MKAPYVLVLGAAIALGVGCSATSNNPSTGSSSGAGGTGPACTAERLTLGAVNKVDLVLVVDNSASMADKQRFFALAVPELLGDLVNPACVDLTTGQPTSAQPGSGLEPCPPGSKRQFPPVNDLHVGLLSSSLGSFGADGCLDKSPAGCTGTPNSTPSDDHGHLVTRAEPCGTMGTVPTYQGQGFLAWDPTQMLTPPGEGNLGDYMTSGLAKSAYDLVVGNGQLGCGFESQNESWYRFLVDPAPYQSISLVNNQVKTTGIDAVLLQQRKDFLRPDSLLVIVDVTDETDTSIKETSSYPLFAAPELHFPHARSECTTKGPKDPCCSSCGQTEPPGCPPNSADASCTSGTPPGQYSIFDEDTSLRAFGLISHKQRYGIEFFYQPSRYVNALTSPTVTDANNATVPNPIYTNLDPTRYTGAVRDPGLVLYATISGVPWQLLARQKNGVPDLVNGVSAIDPTKVGGFKTAKELSLLDPKGNSFWDDIAGDPENYVPAKSPFMQESTVPRTGVDPVTGIATSPPGSPSDANPINGHERTIVNPPNDIEYACIFPLLGPMDCSQNSSSCECTFQNALAADNPLCAPNPNDGNKPTLQVSGRAYPGIKHLAIARGMGSQGIAASICAKQVTDPTAPDYGYRPAVRAIADRMKQSLGGQCLPKAIQHDTQGQIACAMIEARDSGGNCQCNGTARTPVTAEHQCFADLAKGDPLAQLGHWDCFCEIAQASGPALTSCEQYLTSTTDGWCYVDTSTNPALVQGCPSGEQQTLRFVGAGAPQSGATVFFGCN